MAIRKALSVVVIAWPPSESQVSLSTFGVLGISAKCKPFVGLCVLLSLHHFIPIAIFDNLMLSFNGAFCFMVTTVTNNLTFKNCLYHGVLCCM